MRWGIIAALVLSCGVGLAQEPAADAPKEADPVQEKIEAATQRYYEAIEKIEKDLCRQIDAMVESYADRGELEIVIELQNQKKQFLESGYPPAAPVFASNRRRAQIEITKAVNRMERAYGDIVAQLTRKRDFTSATRMRDEWKEILATINPKIGDGFEAIRQIKLQKLGLVKQIIERKFLPDGLHLNNQWVIKNGVLYPSQNPGGIIWSRDSFENFEISFEYMTSPNCNSGIFFRADPSNPIQGGFEIQLASPGLYSGKQVAGSLYDAKEPRTNAANPDGEWNHMTLNCEGPNIRAVLNGRKILDLSISDWDTPGRNSDGTKNKFKTALKDLPRKGHIGFQYHGQAVWFRQVQIKTLSL